MAEREWDDTEDFVYAFLLNLVPEHRSKYRYGVHLGRMLGGLPERHFAEATPHRCTLTFHSPDGHFHHEHRIRLAIFEILRRTTEEEIYIPKL